MSAEHEETAKRLLPCRCTYTESQGTHWKDCVARFRPAVAAALAQAEAEGQDYWIKRCKEQVGRVEEAHAEIARLKAEVEQLRKSLDKINDDCLRAEQERDQLRARLVEAERERETERMRLAACGVAALCNTETSIKEQRISKDNPYYSASYQDVCAAVDREMAIRADRDAAEAKGVKRGLERARELSLPWTKCRCDSAYTERGRHEPNAPHEYADEIVAALDAELAKSAEGQNERKA